MLVAVTRHLPNLRVALAQLLFQLVRPTLDEDPLPGHLVRRRVMAELHGRIEHRRREATVLGALPPLVRLELVDQLRLGDASQRVERLQVTVRVRLHGVLHREGRHAPKLLAAAQHAKRLVVVGSPWVTVGKVRSQSLARAHAEFHARTRWPSLRLSELVELFKEGGRLCDAAETHERIR